MTQISFLRVPCNGLRARKSLPLSIARVRALSLSNSLTLSLSDSLSL